MLVNQLDVLDRCLGLEQTRAGVLLTRHGPMVTG